MNRLTPFLASRPLHFVVGFGLVLLAFTPVTSRAQTVSPVPAPIIITSGPHTINSAGYYQLGADLGVASTSGAIITINASNVTLDFAGHYIVGPNNPASQLSGVLVTEQGNVNIQNGTIAFCYRGVNVSGNGSSTSIAINNQVRNMLIRRCFFEAIRLQTVSGSSVRDCRVTFTGGSTVTNNVFAVYSSAGTGGNQILNTTVSSTTATAANAIAYAIYADSQGALVSNCTVDTATSSGTGGTSYGIFGPDFAVGNVISNCQTGISGAIKYKDNLTANCTTTFSGGTSVGFNN